MQCPYVAPGIPIHRYPTGQACGWPVTARCSQFRRHEFPEVELRQPNPRRQSLLKRQVPPSPNGGSWWNPTQSVVTPAGTSVEPSTILQYGLLPEQPVFDATKGSQPLSVQVERVRSLYVIAHTPRARPPALVS